MRSSTTRPRSSKIGIGTKTVVGILIATAIVISSVLIQYHLPARYNTLLTCGDIEQNPGPRPALLPDDVLEKVKSNDSSLQPLDYQLLNKHMQQLYTLRKTSKTTWTSFVNWVKLLQPSFTFDDEAHLQSRREIYNKGMSSNLRKTKFKLETKLEKDGAKRQKLVADNRSLCAEIKLTFESAEETNKVLINKVAELTDTCERQAERIKELLEFSASIKDKLEDERKRPGVINLYKACL